MSEKFISLWGGIWSSDISTLFSIIILTFFVLSLLAIFRLKVEDRWPFIETIPSNFATPMVNLGPNILTSLGILGTFTGIFIGLIEFNLEDIDGSVPNLIDGLKIAFSTSILGLTAALIIRTLRSFCFPEISLEEDGGDEFLTIIQKLIDAVNRNRKSTEKGFNAINKANLENHNDSISQISALREETLNVKTSIIAGFIQQNGIINDLSAHLKGTLTAETINDFHNAILKFNYSAQQLITWQKNYNSHIAVLEERFQKVVDGFETNQSAISAISKATKDMSRDMVLFNEATKNLHDQINHLHEGLKSLSEVRESAESFVPQLTNVMEEITANLASMAEQLVKDYSTWFETVRKIMETDRKSEK